MTMDSWQAVAPALVRELEQRWSLEVGARFDPDSSTSWVAPARRVDGTAVVLKLTRRHAESEHEADGLREWGGNGTVRLYASIEMGDVTALLLERCVPGTPLTARPEPEQDAVIARLLPRLWHEPPADQRFRPLSHMCNAWADEFEQKVAAGAHVDAGLAREGIALFRELPATAERNVLLCTDLHAGNVLAAEREPWLVIDPKPYAGDPAYDALQHMLNCERLQIDPRALATRIADLLALDRGRVLQWLFARCVQESPDRPDLAHVARRIAPS